MAFGQAQARIANSEYHQAIVADSPYGWWRLADPSGTTALAIKGPNGSIAGSWSLSANTGLPSDSVNKGISASGNSNQEIATGATEQINTFSIEAWVKPNRTITLPGENNGGTGAGTSNNQNYAWFPNQKGNDRGLGMSVGTNGINAVIHGNSTITPIAQYSATISSSILNHVVIVLNAKVPTIYLNGVLVRTGITATATNVYSPTSMSANVASGAGNYGPFNGTMNNAALYSVALTGTQVLTHYLAGLPRAYAQAQAFIGQPATQTGQAQAYIFQNKVFGQAQATVKTFNNNCSGQALAAITQIGFVQSKTGESSGNITLTLDNSPTVGNLLVIVANRRSAHSLSLGLPAPWVELATVDRNDGGVMAWRFATAGMSSSVTITWSSGGGANDGSATIMEFSGRYGGDFISIGTYDSGGAGGTNISLGPVTPKLPFSGVGVILGNDNNPGSFSDNNSYIALVNGLNGQGASPSNYFAYKIIGGLGTSQSVTLTLASGGSRLGILGIFSENPLGGFGSGQAQAQIILRGQGFGQSQADIVGTSLRQTKQGTFSGSWSLTFDTAPLVGSLLVLMGARRQGLSGNMGTAAPWIETDVDAFKDGVTFSYGALAWRISDGTSSYSGSWSSGGGSNPNTLRIFEFTGNWGTDPAAIATYQSAGPNGTSIPLGAVTPKSPNSGVGALLSLSTDSGVTYSNNASYIALENGVPAAQSGAAPADYFAYRLFDALGTSQSVTVTETVTGSGSAGVLAIFSLFKTAGYGQAQADIKANTNKFAQAQASIAKLIIQSASVTSFSGSNAQFSFAKPATSGNLLLLISGARGAQTMNLPSGFTRLSMAPVGAGLVGASAPNAGYLDMASKVSVGGEQSFSVQVSSGSSDFSITIVELATSSTIDNYIAVDNQSATNHPAVAGITGPSGIPHVVIGAFLPTAPSGATNTTYTADSPYRGFIDRTASPGGNLGPRLVVIGYEDTGVTTSYTTGITADNAGVSVKWAGISLVYQKIPTIGYGSGQAQATLTQGIRIVQYKSALVNTLTNVTFTMDSPTTAGGKLLMFVWSRGGNSLTGVSAPWVVIDAYEENGPSGTFNRSNVQAFYKPTTAGETTVSSGWSGVNPTITIIELTSSQFLDSTSLGTQASATHYTLTVDGSTGKPMAVFAVIGPAFTSSGETSSPDAGWTELVESPVDGSNNRSSVIYQIDDIGDASYTPGTTGTENRPWAMIGVSFYMNVNATGFGQAQGFIRTAITPSGQAQADIKVTTRGFGQALAIMIGSSVWSAQAQGSVSYARYQSAQAQAFLRTPFKYGLAQGSITNARGQAFGQARAAITSGTKQQFAQAQAFITVTKGYGQAQAVIFANHFFAQAQADILKKYQMAWGQSQADISRVTLGSGQAQAFISKTTKSGQAQADIKASTVTCGQAQAFVGHLVIGQAQGYIDTVKYLVRYNSHILPGYAQTENFESVADIGHHTAIDVETFTEYIGLKNKVINMEMKITGSTYVETKRQLFIAGSMFRSAHDWSKLYIQNPDRYYLALPHTISMEQDATHTDIIYNLEWEALPWAFSDAVYTASGIGTITVDRSLDDGGWTPLIVLVTGTDITLSGYTATGDFAGYISISGAVSDFTVTSQPYTATTPAAMKNSDYSLFLGPGTTIIETSGATTCVVRWQNRWNI